MKVIPYSSIIYLCKDINRAINNQTVAYRKTNLGIFKIIYWKEFYEIHLMIANKNHGYFIKTFSLFNNAVNFLDNLNEIDLTRILPSDITNNF